MPSSIQMSFSQSSQLSGTRRRIGSERTPEVVGDSAVAKIYNSVGAPAEGWIVRYNHQRSALGVIQFEKHLQHEFSCGAVEISRRLIGKKYGLAAGERSRQRNAPTGGCANGSPRNTAPPPPGSNRPSTLPFAIVATGFPPAANSAPARSAATATAAATRH